MEIIQGKLKLILLQKWNKYYFIIPILFLSCGTSDSIQATRYYNNTLNGKVHIGYMGINLKFVLDSVFKDVNCNNGDTLYCLIESFPTSGKVFTYAFNARDTFKYTFNSMVDDTSGVQAWYLENYRKKSVRFILNKERIPMKMLKRNYLYRVYFENYFVPNSQMGTDFFQSYLIVKFWREKGKLRYHFYQFDHLEMIETPNIKYKESLDKKTTRTDIRWMK